MRILQLFFFCCLLFLMPEICRSQKTDTLKIPSSFLGEDIEVWVTLPDGYDTITSGSPVLVALDADALQMYVPQFIKYLSRPFEQTVPPLLLVAVRSKSPRWRSRSFIPKLGIDSLDSRPDRGFADNMIRFIREELLATISNRYHVNDIRILAGHSLAGLFGLYAMYKDPDLFRAVLAASPSPLNGVAATTYLPAILSAKRKQPVYLYFSAGTHDNRGYTEGNAAMREVLEKNPSKMLFWKQELLDQKTHWTAAPPAFYNGLIWLFTNNSDLK